MSDRRSQRIRAQLRQHPNPRIKPAAEPLAFSEQIRRVYLAPQNHAPVEPSEHAQLAQQLAGQRKERR